MRMLRRMTRRRSSGRRPRPQPAPQGIDRGLLADVEHLAEVVAATIGRLHSAGRGDIARPLESALARLAAGGRR